MQEKLIALAVTSLLSVPALAQSNVTLYGSIDYGYTSLSGSDRTHDDGAGNTVKYKSRNGIDSGITKSNRIGFKGTEDLGNGLKAVFVLEQGLNGDHGPMWSTSQARQTYAGLAGGFGTIAFGRQTTPQHNFTSAVDPFGKNGLGSSANVLMQDKRVNNLAAYISPNFGGFGFILGYTFHAGIGSSSVDENLENNNDARLWVIAPSFTTDNLFVAANYHSAKIKNTHNHTFGTTGLSSPSVFNALDVYASYDFGLVKVGSTFGRRTTKKGVITGADRDSKLTQWMIGATFKVTPNDKILTSYNRAAENEVVDGEDKRRISQWAIGYEHSLSKRTVLYSQFAMQSHNSAFRGDGANAGKFHTYSHDSNVGSVACSNIGIGCSAALYRRGFTAGFRHDF